MQSLQIPHPQIAIFASGSSIHRLSPQAFGFIRERAFTVTLNYAPVHLRGHLNMWSDRKVSEFLEAHYANRPKDSLWLARKGRVTPGLQERVDYWFGQREDRLRGNFTLVWALQLFRRYFPDKTILLFGVDMKTEAPGEAKWYDRYTDFDKKKRGDRYDTSGKLAKCADQLRQYVPAANIYNCNPDSELDYFEKRDWRTFFPLNILHLCATPLAGAPVHLSKIINKYSWCRSRTVLKSHFQRPGFDKLRWDYDLVAPQPDQLAAAIEKADLIHYHRKVYPADIGDKKALIQFHSPPGDYLPRKSLPQFNGRKLVIAQYHPRFYTDARIVPNMIDIWDPSLQPGKKPSDHVKIFYSWATEGSDRWSKKGSEATRKILERIKAKYGDRVEIKVMHNQPYADCLAAKQTAHLCIDECVTGSYHLQSLEGCAAGAATLNFIDQATQSFMAKVTGESGHPFVRTHLDDLYGRLCHYIEHPEALRAQGAAARRWMEKHWDPRKLVGQYLDAYYQLAIHGAMTSPAGLSPADEEEPPPAAAPPSPPARPPRGRSIQDLYRRHAGEDIYIFGAGPSLLDVDPAPFKDKICFGVNFSFEVMPYMDYIFVHVIEVYEAIKDVVDNQKLVLPETLVRQWRRDRTKVKSPSRVMVDHPDAYVYPIQDPGERRDFSRKELGLEPDSRIFTWSTTTHSAIHLAAYMGAKNIYLIGVDYRLFPDGRVHFDSRYYPYYGRQTWHALKKHRQGDEWLAQELARRNIRLLYGAPDHQPETPPPAPPAGKKADNAPLFSIARLYRKYSGKSIYIFGGGPSLFKVNPDDFKHEICFGVNYAFEVMPYMDYILVHEKRPYEKIRRVVDNRKLLLPQTLLERDKHSSRRVPVDNEAAYIYPIQDPAPQCNFSNKHLGLQPDSPIFTWTTTTHSAIHLAAYMGAKTIYLIGVDYRLYQNGQVHFSSRISEAYGRQNWNAFSRHRQGDQWLTRELKKQGIALINLSWDLQKESYRLIL